MIFTRLAKMLVEFDSEAKPHRLITKLIFMTEVGLELMIAVVKRAWT